MKAVAALAVAVAAAVIFAAAVILMEQRASAPVASTPVTTVNEYFTQQGDHPDTVMANGIAAAGSRVDAALYALDRPGIVSALADKHASCSCVRLISDATQSGGANQKSALTTLYTAHVPIKIDHHSGIMHLKLVVIDNATVYEGSFNATNAASTINDEVLFRIDNAHIAQQAAAEYDTMWNDSRRFGDWKP
jgi:phosphatidylserine/phosphatidylglycerophosphate/cardiolipin synthase-like enzyme